MIEEADSVGSIKPETMEYDELWYEWRNKMFSTPRRFLTEEEWLNTCAVFNGCAICGSESIDEKLLLVPPYLGGKLYTYNVLPTCSFCAERIRQSQSSNPLKPLFTLKNIDQQRVTKCLNYLEAQMLGAVFEEFDWENDRLEIVVKVTEDTSCKPFNGVWARRLFDASPRPKIEGTPEKLPCTKFEEYEGISWRLLDA